MENNVTTSLLGLNDNSESDFESEQLEFIMHKWKNVIGKLLTILAIVHSVIGK
jgi:hypothetical protein